jgi:hypothetical protein
LRRTAKGITPGSYGRSVVQILAKSVAYVDATVSRARKQSVSDAVWRVRSMDSAISFNDESIDAPINGIWRHLNIGAAFSTPLFRLRARDGGMTR